MCVYVWVSLHVDVCSVGFVMCGCVYLWVCVCVGFLMFGRMCGFFNVWMCVDVLYVYIYNFIYSMFHYKRAILQSRNNLN